MNYGKSFICTTNDLSSGTAVETARLLIVNPSTSVVNCSIYRISFGTNVSTNNNIFRVYATPTVTSVGTTINPISNYINGAATSVATTKVYSNPTVSDKGDIFLNVMAGATTTNVLDFVPQQMPEIVIAPGGSVLITVRPNTTGVTYSLNVFWTEQ